MGDIEGTYISNYFLPQDGDIGAGTYIEELFKLPSHLAFAPFDFSQKRYLEH